MCAMTGLRLNLGRRIVPVLFGAIAIIAITFAPSLAQAQGGPPPPTPTPIPFPNLTDNTVQLSAGAAQLDIGCNFLQRVGRQAKWG
jgi:X-X-X-Leu-X-X-Gly heptad repeat protein